MSDSQQPGDAGDDQIPPIPPAPSADVPSVPPVPPATSAGVPPVNPYAPPATTVPSSVSAAPVPPVVLATTAAPAANPYAAAPANPYAAPRIGSAPQGVPAAPASAAPTPGAPGYGVAPAYAAPSAAPSRLNVMGLVSLILGGVAFLFGISVGWIPYVGFFFVLLALVGVALGIAGLVAKNIGKGLAIAGTAVSGVALLLTSLISIGMLLFVTSFSNTIDDFGSDDPIIVDPDGGGSSGGDDPNAHGGIDNPAAIGEAVIFADYAGTEEWQIVVGTPNLDANAEVLAAADFNAEPEPGNRYVIVPMTVTYLGPTSDVPYMLLPEFVDAGGSVYDLSYAMYPGSIYEADELATGESTELSLVFEVAIDQIPGSLLRVSSIWGDDRHVAVG